MVSNFFWLTNFSFLVIYFFGQRLPEVHSKFAITLLQSLLFLPLLVVEYLVVTLHYIPEVEGITLLFVSHNLFLIIWSTAALRIRNSMSARSSGVSTNPKFLHALLIVLILTVALFQFVRPGLTITPEGVGVPQFGSSYFASLLCLLVMLLMAWQLEAFWRQLPQSRRRDYGLFVVGGMFVCAVQGGVASYLVTYLELTNDILFLQAIFLLIAWVILVVAVLRHRLLSRKLFVSRKIVYSIVAPSLFAVYFIILGSISLVMRLYGYPLKVVLFWFLVGVGAVGVAILAVSEPVRQRLKFFITTHFYVDKYEYRDEWLAFSALLQHAGSEAKVLEALYQILLESLYTRDIWIWAGNEIDGFELVIPASGMNKEACRLSGSDPVISYLQRQPRLDLTSPIALTDVGSDTFNACLASLPPPRPVLFVPLVTDGQIVGCIALGPEYTGNRYGQDDFDLLIALSSQAASALIAVRLSEEAARLRERRAMQNVSAFLLHDIKNAASLLALVHANARQHMDDPEFRKDMLVAIGDALQRMEKAQASLGMLRDRVDSVWQDVNLCLFLDELLVRFSRRLPGLDITLDCSQGITLRTDPQLLETVLENILLNAYEAGGGSSQVHIAALSGNDGLTISVTNKGPAIPEHLLPDKLFQRFVSDKPDGSGIGLWQVRLILQRLGATITADNPAPGGARFVIRLPMAGSHNLSVGTASSV